MGTAALVVTPGSASANAYVSLTVADQYHLDRPPADNTWAEAVYPSKEQAILWATKLLDRLVPWTGQIVTETQALLWPRYGMLYRNWFSIPSDIIPLDLQHATAEYARQLLKSSSVESTGGTKSQLEELAQSAQKYGLGSVSTPNVSIARAGGYELPERHVPDEVFALLPAGWLSRSRSVIELLRA